MKGRKSKARLDRRVEAFEKGGIMPGPRKGDRWYKTPQGKVVLYHRPGSNRK